MKRQRHPFRSARSLALLLVAAPTAAAQLDLYDDGSPRELVPPADIPGGRALVGDVTGDALPDVLWLADGELVLAYGPSIFRSTNAVSFSATDATVVPSDEPGVADAIAVVNASGAWLLTGYDAGGYTATLLSSSWAGVTRIRCGDTDGDGEPDVVGLSGSDLLLLEDVRSGSPVASTVSVGGTILDFDVVQWNGTGGEELAVLRTNGFRVLSRTGTLLDTTALSTPAGFLCVLGDAAVAAERCALVYSVLGYQVVRTIGDQGDSVTALGLERFFGASAGDADGDGHDDLLLVADDSHELLLLLNRAPTNPIFTVDSTWSETIGVAAGTPTTWSAWPALHDFDLDGDADVIAYVEATGAIVHLESGAIAKESAQPSVVGSWYVVEDPSDQRELSLKVRLPASFPFGANYVQATAWRRSYTAGGNDLGMEAAAVDTGNFPFDAQGDAVVKLALDETTGAKSAYYIELRGVDLTVPEREIIRSGPPVVHAFAPAYLVTEEFLVNFFLAGNAVRVYVVEPPDPMTLCDPECHADRALAPKEVETPEIPPIEVPPDPF